MAETLERQIERARARTAPEQEAEAWDDRCPMCGGLNNFERQGGAEVINRTTGARGLAHVECYLADTDCYELA